MSSPVTPAEASLLGRDRSQRPWQQALVLQVAGGLSRDGLLGLVSERIGYAPRFRKIVSGWPIAGWVDDRHFSLGGHLDEVTLAVGESLLGWLSDRLAEPLSPLHPLWKLTLVHGLEAGGQVVVMRINPVLVDGYDNIHLFQELLDEAPQEFDGVTQDWHPADTTAPDLGSLLTGLDDPINAARGLAASLTGAVENRVRTMTARPVRQYLATTRVSLAAVAQLSARFDCTVHDVLLSLATAGVRGWLDEQGCPLNDELALVPLAVTESQVLESAIGCQVIASFCELPVTATSAAQRLEALASITAARRDSRVSVPVVELTELAGFAAATLQAVAATTVAVGRPHSVLVTNVPGPTQPRYLGPALVQQVSVVGSLTDAEKLNISITSYGDSIDLSVAAAAPVNSWAASVAAELNALRSE